MQTLTEELKAQVVDSKDLTFDNQLVVKPRRLAGR